MRDDDTRLRCVTPVNELERLLNYTLASDKLPASKASARGDNPAGHRTQDPELGARRPDRGYGGSYTPVVP
jgi:hypothetical protein